MATMTFKRSTGLCGVLTLACGALALSGAAIAQPTTDLGRYFGFGPTRTIVIDDDAGPLFTADFNGDGDHDIGVVNNRKSRIELFIQRARPLTDEEMDRNYKVNELRPSRWFDRVEVSVSHRVSAVATHDVDGDGLLDLVYAGSPSEIVIMRQEELNSFEIMSRKRVRGLNATWSSFDIADVTDDPAPEVVAIVNTRPHVFPLRADGALGEPISLGSDTGQEGIIALFAEDFNGDSMTDLLGVAPEHSAPLRLWLQRDDPTASVAERPRDRSAPRGPTGAKDGVIGSELRFESPGLIEVDPVRFPDRDAASIGVIERQSRRVVLYDLEQDAIDSSRLGSGGERDVQIEAFPFVGEATRDRSSVVGDIDGDGLLDLIATDPGGNRIVIYRQRTKLGLSVGDAFSAFQKPKSIAFGEWDDGDKPRIFVLSEEEKLVGVSAFNRRSGVLTYPSPIPLASGGATPVAMGWFESASGPALGVVVKEKRDHALEIHKPGSDEATVVELKGVKRPPQSMLATDIDHDGDVDLLLFTPGEPMVMVLAENGGDPSRVVIDEEMPQFGLVQAAGPNNTDLVDMDGDGKEELLIASANFVRACAFDPESGWRAIEQVTHSDANARFSSVAVLEGVESGARKRESVIFAADTANSRINMLGRDSGRWRIIDTLRIEGFSIKNMKAGAFAGDSNEGLLVMSDGSFGAIRLAGSRAALRQVSAWRSDERDRFEHEIGVGDVNGDGYVDMAVLDAREQMCTILTFSAARKIHLGTEFKVYESRLFRGGDTREFEPSQVIIEDVTGDGGEDLLLLVHDRVIIYPQMLSAE